jgi:hypothetical protein
MLGFNLSPVPTAADVGGQVPKQSEALGAFM